MNFSCKKEEQNNYSFTKVSYVYHGNDFQVGKYTKKHILTYEFQIAKCNRLCM